MEFFNVLPNFDLGQELEYLGSKFKYTSKALFFCMPLRVVCLYFSKDRNNETMEANY